MSEAACRAHQQRIHKPAEREKLVEVLQNALWVRPKKLGGGSQPADESSDHGGDRVQIARGNSRISAVPTPLTLPWPPSVNHYWFRNKNGSMRIGDAGLAFRNNVRIICKGVHKLSGRLRIDVQAFPPDNRRRDIDNLSKAVLDGLQHAGVVQDDNQFDDIRIRRCAVQKPGRLIVEISTL